MWIGWVLAGLHHWTPYSTINCVVFCKEVAKMYMRVLWGMSAELIPIYKGEKSWVKLKVLCLNRRLLYGWSDSRRLCYNLAMKPHVLFSTYHLNHSLLFVCLIALLAYNSFNFRVKRNKVPLDFTYAYKENTTPSVSSVRQGSRRIKNYKKINKSLVLSILISFWYWMEQVPDNGKKKPCWVKFTTSRQLSCS